MTRLLWLAMVSIAGVIVTGCGGANLKSATGTVTYKGAPVAGATVTFVPDKGTIGIGLTDAAGKYSISTEGKVGATFGKHKVTIAKLTASGAGDMTSSGSPEENLTKMMSKTMDPRNQGTTTISVKAEIPTKYSMPDSGLTADVGSDASKNVFDFSLSD